MSLDLPIIPLVGPEGIVTPITPTPKFQEVIPVGLRNILPGARARPIAPPFRLVVGLAFIGVAWPASWLQIQPLGEYSFFPLWLGYILTVDAIVEWRTGSSMLTRNPVSFGMVFLVSIPLWWIFEGINQFTQNWHYLGAESYSGLRYFLLASLHFAIVIPAVFETAELVGSFSFMERFGRGPGIYISRRFLVGSLIVGVVSLLAVVLLPEYAFPLTWLSLFFLMDPINYLGRRPSIIAPLQVGDWRKVVALGLGALICGWFWEMWNFWAFPKWEYNIENVDFIPIFGMPLLGYGGYIPFGLEVFAAYHFILGMGKILSGRPGRDGRSSPADDVGQGS